MSIPEIALTFSCDQQTLIGVLHPAQQVSKIGVLVIVGGPQYRVGSHRQFVLLARHLAAQGIPTMRFDVRGMGDASGEPRSFAVLDDDILAAVDCFLSQQPDIEQVVIWGLCDAASAALFYAYQDSRIAGLVLLNPWVFTEQGAAKTYLKHYYLQRLFSKDLWRKVLRLQFNFAASLTSLLTMLKQARRGVQASEPQLQGLVKVDANLALPVRMRECLQRFTGPVLLILSGRDLTADEFREAVKADAGWQALLADSRITREDFADADHTFSSAVARDQVAQWTTAWLKGLKA